MLRRFSTADLSDLARKFWSRVSWVEFTPEMGWLEDPASGDTIVHLENRRTKSMIILEWRQHIRAGTLLEITILPGGRRYEDTVLKVQVKNEDGSLGHTLVDRTTEYLAQ